MVSLPVYDRNGQQVGSYDIDPAELSPRISKQLMHDAVVMYQSNLRQGTSKTKSRGEIAASTKKLYRQKGTGNARAGSRKSPIRRGGGHAFAIRPRDWSYSMPRKALRLATRMALASRIQDGELTLIDDLAFEAPKTREMASILKALGLSGQRLLVAVDGYQANVYKSIRNIDAVSVLPVGDLNALEVLAPKRVLMTRAALEAFRHSIARRAAQPAAQGE